MVTTRSAAASNTIAAARALRQQRRARTAEEEILGYARPGAAKQHRKRGRRARTANNDPSPASPSPSPPAASPLLQEHHILHQEDHQASNLNPHPETSQQKQWFGTIAKIPAPNPSAPIFNPSESLIHFSPGCSVPKPDDDKPMEASGTIPVSGGFGGAGDAEYAARKHEAIRKAATAVLAHMNGHDVARADYVAILDGMLADPDVRVQLPTGLIEQYDAAVKGQETTIFNGGLIDKFVHATQRATVVTAKSLMRDRNGRRHCRPAGAQSYHQHHKPLRNTHPFHPSRPPPPLFADPGPPEPHQPLLPMLGALYPFEGFRDDLHDVPMPTTEPSPSHPLLFAQPLTEANLQRRAHELAAAKGKAKENTGGFRAEASRPTPTVMRTTKHSYRQAPYPRRDSASTARAGIVLSPSLGTPHGQKIYEDCGYSVYSASTSTAHRESEAHHLGRSLKSGVKKMLEPHSYEAKCVRTAQSIMEEVARCHGPEVAEETRIGCSLLHCYDMLKEANVDLLSQTMLEQVPPAPSPRLPPAPASSQALQPLPPPSYSFPQPSQSLPSRERFLHPVLGSGSIYTCRIFQPDLPLSNPSNSHHEVLLDAEMLPPPPPTA
ncbi:hypothetical protein VP01_851g5 [Puccinia sorghi]|uniref:Uncharacterized protein n=1 Tax=Puccinia sorghi TaxID=27349 RepID=A0A0L6U9U8_9BASI|nr:hypothetical protein VP01_851g5 [Puccinia sorghi]